MDEDLQHLRILSIFHYIVGAMIGLFSCIPIIHLVIGILIVTGELRDPHGHGPPEAFGWFFIVIPALFILTGWTIAASVVVAGRKLSAHTAHTYCLVVAGIECMFMPFGTVLGVFTIIVLVRPSVRRLFAKDIDPRDDFGSSEWHE